MEKKDKGAKAPSAMRVINEEIDFTSRIENIRNGLVEAARTKKREEKRLQMEEEEKERQKKEEEDKAVVAAALKATQAANQKEIAVMQEALLKFRESQKVSTTETPSAEQGAEVINHGEGGGEDNSNKIPSDLLQSNQGKEQILQEK